MNPLSEGMTQVRQAVFPFAAIVGQERMKRALLLNAINPRIGGVLIFGERGSAKSTAARALAALLPPVSPEAPPPRFANLPIGATEDRVLGSIDFEKALRDGQKRFQPGLLAEAHGGVLYIDEVNLLSDYLVDGLLDAAASGLHVVEREGISVAHPADFVLIGTMNPEEGELRPQLLDRFALAVEVERIVDPKLRVEAVRRRVLFEEDPGEFLKRWSEEERGERERILAARQRLTFVRLSEEMRERIATMCVDAHVEGLRADLVIHKAARTIAAYEARDDVTTMDVDRAAELALTHRRRDPPPPSGASRSPQPKAPPPEGRPSSDHPAAPVRDRPSREPSPSQGRPPTEVPRSSPAGARMPHESLFDPGESFRIRRDIIPKTLVKRLRRESAGRRLKAMSGSRRGRYIRSMIPNGAVNDIAVDATLRAAALHHTQRRKRTPEASVLRIERSDLRQKVREERVGGLMVLVIDASGSMAADKRMAAAKATLLSLLRHAYQQRDLVSCIAFRDHQARLMVPPTRRIPCAERFVRALSVGGQTPLADGLARASELVQGVRRKEPQRTPCVVLITDGRGNESMGSNRAHPVQEALREASRLKQLGVKSLVIDTETGAYRLHLARAIATALSATYVRLERVGA